jgi:hypothetical protein
MIPDNLKGDINQVSDEDIETWKEEANNNQILQEHGIEVINKRTINFLKVSLAVSIIGMFIFAGLFIYYMQKGAFKSELNQTIPVTSNFNATINNEYQNAYSPSTNNQFNNNFTINVYTNST